MFHRRPARTTSSATLALLLGAAAARAQTVVNIDATKSGCTACSAYAAAAPGLTTGFVGARIQRTFGPGTYAVTNAATASGALPGANPTFTAWTYNSPWLWSFGAADAATGTIVLEDYIGQTYATQAAAAGATGVQTYDGARLLPGTSTAGFTDTFTLAATTTLDFYILDYYPADNAGGVSVAITPVGATTAPEPATWALVGAGALGIAGVARRRR
ncbi:hypothetical protein tb265_05750 [Gemmatimonadetes bacterium T265]|nr:hypothetical protein tb265_05750 [Gemmatimonadetes bacterium T265]